MRALPDLTCPAPQVAPLLLGCLLSRGPVVVRLVEVEAYAGAADPASHAFRGPSTRNAVMFGPPGRLYVYRIHQSVCANVVCGPEGVATAVLLRAGEVVAGADVARARRQAHRSGPLPDREVARGPGNLCRALGLLIGDDGITADLRPGPMPEIVAGPRVNVARAADRPWRFWVPGSPAVSAYQRHPKASGW